jgi:hypothetical protein
MFLLLSNRAQQSQLEFSFAPDKAPATVPTEMFSNDMESKLNTNFLLHCNPFFF